MWNQLETDNKQQESYFLTIKTHKSVYVYIMWVKDIDYEMLQLFSTSPDLLLYFNILCFSYQ